LNYFHNLNELNVLFFPIAHICFSLRKKQVFCFVASVGDQRGGRGRHRALFFCETLVKEKGNIQNFVCSHQKKTNKQTKGGCGVFPRRTTCTASRLSRAQNSSQLQANRKESQFDKKKEK
jgi:hypothetical protein